MESKEQKKCEYSKCNNPLPEGCKSNKKFCCDTCRAKSWKEKNEVNIPNLLDRIGDLEKRVQALEDDSVKIISGIPG
jgi:hypothetical protein